MKVAVIAGLPGSGKTELIRAIITNGLGTDRIALILNNNGSSELVGNICSRVDVYPFRSPCARSKQFMLKVDSISVSGNIDMIISEPPGTCIETSAPMINPVYVVRKDVSIAPLITVIDVSDGLDLGRSSVSSMRLRNMVYESDCVVISKSDLIDEGKREEIKATISEVNDCAKILFVSTVTGENIGAVADAISGDAEYSRPLNN